MDLKSLNPFSAIFAKAYLALTVALVVALAAAILVARGERGRADKHLAGALAWRETAMQWKARSEEWQDAFRNSEKARTKDQTIAREAAGQAEASCKLRERRARQSALAIRDIVTTEPTYDPRGCPTEQLAPTDRLSNALRPRSAPE